MIEAHRRSVVKTISWRFIATLITMGIVFLITRKEIIMLEVGILDMVAKMMFYYLHERVWGKIKWGKVTHPLEVLGVKKELSPEDLEKVKAQLKSLGYMD